MQKYRKDIEKKNERTGIFFSFTYKLLFLFIRRKLSFLFQHYNTYICYVYNNDKCFTWCCAVRGRLAQKNVFVNRKCTRIAYTGMAFRIQYCFVFTLSVKEKKQITTKNKIYKRKQEQCERKKCVCTRGLCAKSAFFEWLTTVVGQPD